MDPQPAPADQPVPAAPAQAPLPPPPRRKSRWPKILLILFILSVILNFALLSSTSSSGFGNHDVTEKYHSLQRLASDKVAIISLEGAILSGDGYVKNQIDRIRDDDNVKAVVLRVNSPGGGVGASHYLYHHLKEMTEEKEIPLVVSMGTICASGGYYISMAVGDQHEDVIFAEPTTWTGSIGVIIPHYDVSQLMAEWKIEDDSIASHHLKQMGSPTRPLTEEEREIFQGLVNDAFVRFKDVIKGARPKFVEDEEALNKLATGQVFTCQQAIDGGLVDQQGYLEDAIDRAIELAGLKQDNVKVVEYEQQLSFMAALMGASAQQRSLGLDLSAVMDLATPRAYYLFSWTPLSGARSY